MAAALTSLRHLMRVQMLIILGIGALAFAFNGAVFFYENRIEQEKALVEQNSRYLSQNIATGLESVLASSRALARSPAIQTLFPLHDKTRIVDTIRSSRRRNVSRIFKIALVSPQGKVYEDPSAPIGAACRKSLSRLLNQEESSPSLPSHGASVPERGHVDTLMPVRNARDDILGYVFVSFRLGPLVEALSKNAANVRYRVRDDFGNIAYASPGFAPDQPGTQLRTVAIPHTHWTLDVMEPSHPAFNFWALLLLGNGILAGLVIVVFVFFQHRVQKEVRSEVEQLQQTLEAIHRGGMELPYIRPRLEDTVKIWHNIKELAHDIHLQRKQLELLSLSDSLTGLPNRRFFENEMTRAIALAKRGVNVCLAVIDLDHFKELNDKAGHLAGDAALRILGQTLRQHLRSSDFCARLGGDEFAVLCINSHPLEKEEGLNRLADAFKTKLNTQSNLRGHPLSLSIGLIALDPARDRNPTEALHRADAALYEAKSRGRNQIVFGD